MCGRYFISEDSEPINQIIERIDESNPLRDKLRFGEIFPGDHAPVILSNGLTRSFAISRWGFVGSGKSLIINARAESILEKPMFKNLAIRNRCLIPANGFYEWDKTGEKPKKIFFKTENRFFYFAGLFQLSSNGELRFVILTTAPNSQVMNIHNRMPVMFEKEQANVWMSEISGREEFFNSYGKLLIPYEKNLLLENV